MTEHINEVLDEDRSNDVSLRVYATTKGGKDIIIFVQKGSWQVKFTTGGQLPKALTGKWTTYQYAQCAVDLYLSQEVISKPLRRNKLQD